MEGREREKEGEESKRKRIKEKAKEVSFTENGYMLLFFDKL